MFLDLYEFCFLPNVVHSHLPPLTPEDALKRAYIYGVHFALKKGAKAHSRPQASCTIALILRLYPLPFTTALHVTYTKSHPSKRNTL